MDSVLSAQLRKLGTLNKRLKKEQAKLKKLETEYEELRDAVLGAMNAQDLSSVKSGGVRAIVKKRDQVVVEDWDKFYVYISRQKAYDCLQRRPAVRAIADRLEAGKKVPVKMEKVRSLQVTIEET